MDNQKFWCWCSYWIYSTQKVLYPIQNTK